MEPTTTTPGDGARSLPIGRPGPYEEASKAFAEALRQDPNNADALSGLADISTRQGRAGEALDLLLRGLRANPSHEGLLGGLEALAGDESAGERFEERIEELLERAELLPPERQMLCFLAKLCGYRTPYRAAAATVNLTPKLSELKGLPLQGYATAAARKARSVRTPLSMHLLLIEDQNHTRCLIIAADLFGFDQQIVGTVRKMLRPWGIPPEGIVLNASHTHYAPGAFLFDQLEACFLFAGQTSAQIGVNRRMVRDGRVVFGPNPGGYYDANTPVMQLSFLRSGGSVVVVNHGCHPTGLDAACVISGDYPAYMCEVLKEFGIANEVVFLQGAAGNVKEGAGTSEPERQFARNEKDVAANGVALAEKVLRRLRQGMTPVTGAIFARIQTADLPLQEPKQSMEADKESIAP